MMGPIGVDFDNTVICYDQVFYQAAIDKGFISNQLLVKKKKDIRNFIRSLEDGETKWRMLQAIVYGERIQNATPMPGVAAFIESCMNKNISLYIISHKTRDANAGGIKIDLRKAAINWLQGQGFLNGKGVSQKDVIFVSTREEKIQKIKELDCAYFIDDLEETFLEPTFPKGVQKILFSQNMPDFQDKHLNLKIASTWKEVGDYIFNT
jgi:hypothetical protein